VRCTVTTVERHHWLFVGTVLIQLLNRSFPQSSLVSTYSIIVFYLLTDNGQVLWVKTVSICTCETCRLLLSVRIPCLVCCWDDACSHAYSILLVFCPLSHCLFLVRYHVFIAVTEQYIRGCCCTPDYQSDTVCHYTPKGICVPPSGTCCMQHDTDLAAELSPVPVKPHGTVYQTTSRICTSLMLFIGVC